MMRLITGFLLIVVLLLSGCSSPDDGEANQNTTPTSESTTPEPSPSPEATLSVPETEQDGPTVLNIWVVEGVNPDGDTSGSAILAAHLATFETNRPDLVLNIEVKAASGPGSALSYLRTGREVAPSILPDLIILSADQLEAAAAEQLIVPLDNLIVPAAVDDLFPAADYLARVDDKLFGFPFAMGNLSHMAFNSDIFSETIPTTWKQLTDDPDAIFTFPGDGVAGAELALQMYLSLGGSLHNESGLPVLEVEPLAAALELLRVARRQGLLPIQTVTMTTLDESWQAFNAGQTNSVMTNEKQYSAQRTESIESGFAAIPGPEEPLTAIVTAQTWAISTLDSSRQTLVADLLNWLIAAPNMGDWTLAEGILPARKSAFQEWPAEDSYFQFLRLELERAEPYPYTVNGPILEAISNAVYDVLSLSKTSQQAAQEAVDSLAQ